MSQHVELILNKIAAKNPQHAQKLRKDLLQWDQPALERFEQFYSRYEDYLQKEGRPMDFGVDGYLQIIEATLHQRMEHSMGNLLFSEPRLSLAGEDGNASQLNGMLLARFLWRQQFALQGFFAEKLSFYASSPLRYLEICADQWLWMEEAMDQLGWVGVYDMLDLGQGAASMAQEFLPGRPISFFREDFETFEAPYQYDLIVIGEVLGRMRDPRNALKKVRNLLADNGSVFLTTTVNAPVRSRRGFSSLHILKEIIHDAGFSVEQDITIVADDLPMERVEPLKAAISYGAFLK